MIRNASRKSALVSAAYARGKSNKHKFSISFLALIIFLFFFDLAVPAEAPLSPGISQLLLLTRDTVTLRFDVSGFPADKPILSAKMKVYVNSCSVCGGSAYLAAYKLTTAWHESTVTWQTPWEKYGGDFDATTVSTTPIMNPDAGTWKDLDITPWVQAWVAAPGSNNGVILRLINQTSTQYQLSSSENAVPAWAPVLTVEYGVP